MTDISPQMKRDNWDLYVLARSNDPMIMIPYTRKLVSNLIAAMAIAEEPRYNDLLMKCLTMANEAWLKCSAPGETNWGPAVQDCEGVLDQVTQLIYDKRWATAQPDSFKLPIKVDKGATNG